MVDNPGTWTGLTVVTGSITPTFEMEMSKDNSFVDGSTVPYGVDFWANLYEPSLITAARLQSPTGKWYGFGVDSADIGQQKKWSPNIPDGSAAAFPDGTYTVEVTWAGGTYSSSFAMADKVVMPTQIPVFTGPAQGQTDASTDLTLTWQPVTDSKVDVIKIELYDSDDNDILDEWQSDTALTSWGPVTLNASSNYRASVAFLADYYDANADGLYIEFKKRNEVSHLFRTAGGPAVAPDLAAAPVTATTGVYDPGDTFSISAGVENLGAGNAIATSGGVAVPFYYEIRLSKDQTWGNADDVVLHSGSIIGVMGGEAEGGPMVVTLPDSASAGTYYVGVKIDADDQVVEADKTNNVAWSTQTITVAAPMDLLWKNLSVTPASLTAAGGNLTVSRSYQVKSSAATADFSIQYHLSQDTIWGNGDDIALSPDEVISAGAGKTVGTHAGSVTLYIGAVAAGTYYVLGRIDAGGAVTETDEDNNEFTGGKVTVTAAATGQAFVGSFGVVGFDGDHGTEFSSETDQLTMAASGSVTGMRDTVVDIYGGATDAPGLMSVSLTLGAGNSYSAGNGIGYSTADGKIWVHAVASTDSHEETAIGIALRQGTGLGTATLDGHYNAVLWDTEHGSVFTSGLATADFDSAGNFNVDVLAASQGQDSGNAFSMGTDSGSYTLSSNGRFTAGNVGGWASADGSIVAWAPIVATADEDGGLNVAVRETTGHTPADLAGQYHFVVYACDDASVHSSGAGYFVFDGSGNYSGTLTAVADGTPGSTALPTGTISGTYTVADNGEVVLDGNTTGYLNGDDTFAALAMVPGETANLQTGLVLLVRDPDVALAAVVKEASYTQIGTGAPTLSGDGFQFRPVIVESAAQLVTSASVTMPGGSVKALAEESGDSTQAQWSFESPNYGSRTAMDAAYTNGAYQLTIHTVHDGSPTLSLTLTGNVYPTAPYLKNYNTLNGADPSMPIAVTWNAMSNGTAADFIQFGVDDDDGTTVFETAKPDSSGALDGKATGVTIPAGTLLEGHTYHGWIEFIKFTSRDTTDYSGIVAVGAYGVGTGIDFTTGYEGATAPASLTGNTIVSFGGDDPDGIVQIIKFTSGTQVSVSYLATGEKKTFTYSYSVTGLTTAELLATNSHGDTYPNDLSFTTATTGFINGNSTFVTYASPIQSLPPTSFGTGILSLHVTSGAGSYPSSDDLSWSFGASGKSYATTGTADSSTGTCSYTRGLGGVAAGATVAYNDSALGKGKMYLAFTSATAGNFYLTDAAGTDDLGDYSYGTFDLEFAPTHLAFAQPPASTVMAGQTISSAGTASAGLVVNVLDVHGNIVANDSSDVTIALCGVDGTLEGTTTVQAVNGVATFDDLTLTQTGTYTFTVTDTDDAIPALLSKKFTVAPGAASQMAWANDASDCVAGAKMKPILSLQIQDEYGNVVVNDSSTVTLSVASGPGVITGAVAAKVKKGTATFSNIVLKTAGDYTLHVADGSLPEMDSADFTVAPGVAKKLVFTPTLSGSQAAGTVFVPTLNIMDGFGNLVSTSNANVTLVLVCGPKGYTYTSGTVAAVDGAAAFGSITLTRAGVYKFKATAAGVAAAMDNFTVLAGAADHLAFVQQPLSGKVGTPLKPVYIVQVQDKYENVIAADTSNVTLAINTGPTGAVLTGKSTLAAKKGVVTFSGLKLSLAGTYTLRATDGVLAAATSPTLTVS